MHSYRILIVNGCHFRFDSGRGRAFQMYTTFPVTWGTSCERVVHWGQPP